jgi:hypothetical protein
MLSKERKDSSSKVRLRGFLGRIFSSPNASNNNGFGSDDIATTSNLSGNGGIAEISGPYNTVHRIHVGYDGQKFSGLPQSWLDILRRDLR